MPSLAANRTAKVQRIVEALDFSFVLHGRPLWGAEIVQMLTDAPEAFWERVQAKVSPKSRGAAPSSDTRAAVIAAYQRRTEGAGWM